jgi:dynein intermediate chain 2
MDDLQAPIMTTRYDKSYLTGGCWSTTRPGVFFTTKTDGTLDIWDLFHKQNEPTFSTKVGDCGLSCIKVQKQGGLVALGSTDGTISIVEISKGLSQPLHNEKQSIANMFEREQKREKNLELRLIQRERDQKIASKQKNTVKRLDPNADDAPATLEVLQKVEEAFYNAIEEDAKQAMAANNEELLEADKLAEEAAPAAAKSEPESADAAAVEPVADDAAETPAPTTE